MTHVTLKEIGEQLDEWVERASEEGETVMMLHYLWGMVWGVLADLHKEMGEHPAECCRYCADREVRRAAIAFADQQSATNWAAYQEAKRRFEES